jgi:hypothetical protein
MAVFDNRASWYANFQENWLAKYQQTGETDWKIYQRPRNETTVSGRGIDLRKARLALITSAGGYLPASQQPFDAENDLGDYTIRLFPATTPLDQIAFAHTHYDHAAVNQDQQVLVPLRHLETMVSEGMIGELAPSVISYMGYQPDMTRTVDELIPAIVAAAKAENVQAALLVPS